MQAADVLVVGSGIAGLSFALQLTEGRPDLRIDILCKSDPGDSSTMKAQGGIAAVCDLLNDSPQQHINDTMRAGSWLSDPGVVEMVVRDAPFRIADLRRWGVVFDEKSKGVPDLHKEGGHSVHRILHRKDSTGAEIEEKLLARCAEYPQIRMHTRLFASDLLVSLSADGVLQYTGLRVFDAQNGRMDTLYSRVLMMASGSCGMVYACSTNPEVATGDGVAMASRAGARIRDMRYMQFHPTALFEKGQNGSLFLITEALRGYGAYLINRQGRRFLFDDDARGELATRDVVSASILKELRRSGEPCVYLDLRHLDACRLEADFPMICTLLKNKGIDPASEPVPVIPAAHYQCGGVACDLHGESSIRGLYVSGECASTGLHGSNRLASNSLLEALVFSQRAAQRVGHECKAQSDIHTAPSVPLYFQPLPLHLDARLEQLRQSLRAAMSAAAFPLPGEAHSAWAAVLRLIDEAGSVLRQIGQNNFLSIRMLELRNMLEVAALIVKDAQKHEQNHLLETRL